MAFDLVSRWRAAGDASHRLDALLAQADPSAALALRNEWLMELAYWIRRPLPGSVENGNPFPEHTRLRFLLQVLARNPQLAVRFAQTARSILRDNDGRSLFLDIGMAARPGIAGELLARVEARVLPLPPDRGELADVLAMLFVSPRDAEWVAALAEDTVTEVARLLRQGEGGETDAAPRLAEALEDSILLLSHQIAAAPLDAPLRMRLENPHGTLRLLMQLTDTAHRVVLTEPGTDERMHMLNQLHACLGEVRRAVAGVYRHLEHSGVSVEVVFQVERAGLRIERLEQLLAVWAETGSAARYPALVARLIQANLSRRSVAGLLGEAYALLGRKVVERSAETGEHYIARTGAAYRRMLGRAAGGGAVTALTVWVKLFIGALHLNGFIEGVLYTINYTASFLGIYFCHFTLATKQPAMTAPALARKLDDVGSEDGRRAFADETMALIRSQVAAIAGNLVLVCPVALAVQLAAGAAGGILLITPAKASATMHGLSLLGPTPLYAALTGVLLWLSSLASGWMDNWFALHQLRAGIAGLRRVRWAFGARRARAMADAMRRHVAGIAGNVALGILLGMVPTVFAYVGIPVEVRHVTLSAGSLAAAVGVLGAGTVRTAPFWWAVGGIASMAVLNLAVSFALAFSMALRSHRLERTARRQLQRAVWQRMLRHPLQVVLPPLS